MSDHTRDYLTLAQQRFLIKLAEVGTRITGADLRVFCPENGETHYSESADEYLDICGNLEHFWVCFGEKAEFYIVPQIGPLMEMIADYYSVAHANTIYDWLDEEFGE